MDRHTVVVFGGTSEGVEICRFLKDCGVRVVCCVATDYGSSFPGCEDLEIHVGRLTREGMEELLIGEGAVIGVDATHPYASEAHENIHQACHFTEIEYLRVSRSSTDREQEILYLKNHERVIDFLSHTQGNILLTIGSKELSTYMDLPEAKERIYARVLSLPSVILECERLGLEGRHLIAMQGPYSAELNAALLSQYEIKYMVTKDTGKEGGFPEKVEGAKRAGVTLVVVERPAEPEGLSLMEAKEFLINALSLTPNREVTLLGIGMGGEGSLTLEGLSVLSQAELVIGAERMLESLKGYTKKATTLAAYRGGEILSFLWEHPSFQKVVIALSGDVGFYSGARGILKCLQEAEIKPRMICGISSVQYFFARLKLSWEDALLLSGHGTGVDIARQMRRHKKVFALLGSEDGVRSLAKSLAENREEGLTLYVGERLSYPEEKILKGRPEDFLDYQGDPLSVVVSIHENPGEEGELGEGRGEREEGEVREGRGEKEEKLAEKVGKGEEDKREVAENQKDFSQVYHLPDSAFERGRVPMTKEEVRCLALAKLSPREGDVCWDVGAGTGSVTATMGFSCPKGEVFAIEKREEALALTEKNVKRLGLSNVTLVEGEAPMALEGLPAPDRVFVGGSGGELREILEVALKASRKAGKALRLVVTCVTLETMGQASALAQELFPGRYEVTQVSIARAQQLGDYHLMKGENPVYLFTLWEERNSVRGQKADESVNAAQEGSGEEEVEQE